MLMRVILLLCLFLTAEGDLCSQAAARDARLDQKVSCASADRRLHSVIEELSRASGVDIRCGRNDKDWQVRDIPVVISIKNIPLRDVLKLLADSTHLLLSRDKPETEAERARPVYRLWRDPKRTKEIATYSTNRVSIREKLAYWSWDVTLAMPNLPDSAFIKEKKGADWIRFQLLREWGKVLKGLGPQAKNETFAGHTTKQWLEDGAAAGSTPLALTVRHAAGLRALEPEYDRFWGENGFEKRPMPAATSADFTNIRVKIYGRTGETANVDMEVRLSSQKLHLNLIDEATRAVKCIKDGTLPPQPSTEQVDRPGSAFASPDLKVVRSDADWNLPLLKAKVTLSLPQDGKGVTCSQLLSALSTASGIPLVCEDFESHKSEPAPNVPAGRETTVGTVLKALEDKFTWLVDDEERSIAGWSKIWPERHTNLMPESLLVEFEQKLNTNGLYLDDVTPLAHFSEDAFFEWVYQSPKLNAMRACVFGDSKAWAFYDTLSPRYRKLASSEGGLPLARFDPKRISEIFGIGEVEVIPGLSLKVRTGSAIQISGDVYWLPRSKDGTLIHPHWLPKGLPKQDIYHMELSGKKLDGSDFGWRGADGPAQPLPIFSPEREAELVKAATLPQHSQ